jgi:hypothetical protein
MVAIQVCCGAANRAALVVSGRDDGTVQEKIRQFEGLPIDVVIGPAHKAHRRFV